MLLSARAFPLVAATIVGLCLTAGPAAAGPADERKAVELYGKSETYYKAGRFQEAADLLRKAYSLHPDPELIYNLARALEGLGDAPGALDAYQRYLAEAQHLSDRKVIEARIASLEHQIAVEREIGDRRSAAAIPSPAAPVAPAPVAPAPVPPAPEVRAARPGAGPWILAGLGVTTIAAGAVLRALAFTRNQTAVEEPVQTRALVERHSAEALLTVSSVTLAAGAAVTVTGGALLLLGFRQGSPGGTASLQVSPLFGPSWIGIAGRFQ